MKLKLPSIQSVKDECPHKGEGDFHSRVKVELANMDHNTIAKRMTLARYLPLLEQHRPNDQKAALALIKAQQPQKPKAIPTSAHHRNGYTVFINL